MVAQQARGAGGIILDANTGEIIAMASLPVFDPNKLAADPAKNCNDSARCNDMVQSRYELGSTFKPLAIAAAMVVLGHEDEIYREVPWAVREEPIAVLHLFAVGERFRGLGVGKAALRRLLEDEQARGTRGRAYYDAVDAASKRIVAECEQDAGHRNG